VFGAALPRNRRGESAKKLEEAARYLAGGSLEDETGFEVDESIVDAYRELGAPEEFLEQIRESMRRKTQVDDGLELFDDNLLAFRVFEAMDTQWDRSGMDGSRVGLNFGRAPVFMRMLGVPLADRAGLLADLKRMERAALVVWTEKRG
jgi:hypothetical protein